MLARLRMLPAIGLHGHPQRGARELQHERRHRMLTSENASLWCYPAIGTKDAAPHRWDTFERHGRILSPATRTAPPPCPPPRHATRGRGKWYGCLGCQLLDGIAHE
jgi:hypothetical protein